MMQDFFAVEISLGEESLLRPVAWRGSEVMGVSAIGNTTHLAIAAWPWPQYFSPEDKLKGVTLCLADWKRPSPETAPSQSKAAGLVKKQGLNPAIDLMLQARVN